MSQCCSGPRSASDAGEAIKALTKRQWSVQQMAMLMVMLMWTSMLMTFMLAYSPSDDGSECPPLDDEDLDDECPLTDLPVPLADLEPASDPSTHPQSHGKTEEAGESAHQSTNPQPISRSSNRHASR